MFKYLIPLLLSTTAAPLLAQEIIDITPPYESICRLSPNDTSLSWSEPITVIDYSGEEVNVILDKNYTNPLNNIFTINRKPAQLFLSIWGSDVLKIKYYTKESKDVWRISRFTGQLEQVYIVIDDSEYELEQVYLPRDCYYGNIGFYDTDPSLEFKLTGEIKSALLTSKKVEIVIQNSKGNHLLIYRYPIGNKTIEAWSIITEVGE